MHASSANMDRERTQMNIHTAVCIDGQTTSRPKIGWIYANTMIVRIIQFEFVLSIDVMNFET